MTDAIRLERLHVFLNRLMSDAEIVARPRFGTTGIEKIARHMSVDTSEVQPMLDRLIQHLDGITEEEDGEPRYSYEEDSLGGLTVRDAKTGKEKFLNVQQANNLLKQLSDNDGTEQSTLATIMTENVMESCLELSADEMTGNSIFNFPWKLNENMGFASAQYSGFGRNFKIRIVSVMDQQGNTLNEYDTKSLYKIALNFIDEA